MVKVATPKVVTRKPVRKAAAKKVAKKTKARGTRSGTQQAVMMRDLKNAFIRLFKENGWTIRYERHGAAGGDAEGH